MRSGTGFMGLYLNSVNHFIGCPFELRRIWNNIGGVPIASDVCGNICPGLNHDSQVNVNLEALKVAFTGEVLKNMRIIPDRQPRFLSKNPHLSNKIMLVHKLFPNAQFIWTIRNMEDVICSLLNLFERDDMRKKNVRHIWPSTQREGLSRCFGVEKDPDKIYNDKSHVFPGGDISHLGEYWLETNRALRLYADQFGPHKILQIRQEDVIAKPAEIRRRIASFLNIRQTCFVRLKSRVKREKMKNWKRGLNEDELLRVENFKRINRMEINHIYLNSK